MIRSMPIFTTYLFSLFSTSLKSSLEFLFLFRPITTVGDRTPSSLSLSSSLETLFTGELGRGLGFFSWVTEGGDGGVCLVAVCRCTWGWTTAVGSFRPLLSSWRPSKSSCCLSGSRVDVLDASCSTFG